MFEKIQSLIQYIKNAQNPLELDQLKAELLGKSGLIAAEFKNLSSLNAEEKITKGQEINQLKNDTLEAIHAKRQELDDIELEKNLQATKIDVTLPAYELLKGSISPISQATEEMLQILARFNFTVADGPNLENDWHNFTALNIDENHPARASHDTFYLDNNLLLRTHTSPVQIRYMKQHKPPFRFVAPGRVYRADYDATHTPMFHQIEGMVIDKNINFAHLKGFLIEFIQCFFEKTDIDLLFRPSFFPFTEPSAEVDIYTKEFGKPLEVLGCGMVHPKVLTNVGIDPEEYQGFAFGLGVERFAMLKYGINDLRKFFEGDARWFKHYNFSSFDVPNFVGGLTR
jgi:phenylalanyl-tRNA synthetase alpha chain